MEKPKEEEAVVVAVSSISSTLVRWVKKDYIIIAICLLSVLLCGVFYLNGASIIQECNNNCVEQFKNNCKTYSGEAYSPELYTTNNTLPILNIDTWRLNNEDKD